MPLVDPITAPVGLRRRVRDILLFGSYRPEGDGYLRKASTELEKPDKINEVRAALEVHGRTERLAGVTERLDSSGLDRTQRYLLSIPGVYAGLVAVALAEEDERRLTFDDAIGLANFIVRKLDEGPRHELAAGIVEGIVKNRAIAISDAAKQRVIEKLSPTDLLADSAKIEETVTKMVIGLKESGSLPEALEAYITISGISPSRFTPGVKKAMLSYLQKIGVDSSIDAGNVGDYDEIFVLAYNQAIQSADGEGSDPIDAVRQRGAVADWNFEVDAFETVEEQGVIPENILAAGALDYVYELGERMGIFKLADAVVHRWASGQIDLESGESTAKMYRYWKLRSERMQDEERAMLYKRVLNLGDGQLLSGSVANEQFQTLWGTLMEKVTDYITRSEEKKSEDNSVSRTPIYQATKQLQYNLTEYMTGMAHLQVTEMYRQMQEAKALLEDPQIVDYFGNGRRRSLWTVIERGHKELLGQSINISAIRTSAVDGNRVFKWIANFDQGTVSDADFDEFRDAAESWIIAQSMEGEAPASAEPPADHGAASSNGKKDEFDSDWDR